MLPQPVDILIAFKSISLAPDLSVTEKRVASALIDHFNRQTTAAGFWSYWVGSLHEFVGWFLGRVPLNHLPSANITINATAVSNGQFGIAHEVLRPAVPTGEVGARGEWFGRHQPMICALARQHASARWVRGRIWGVNK